MRQIELQKIYNLKFDDNQKMIKKNAELNVSIRYLYKMLDSAINKTIDKWNFYDKLKWYYDIELINNLKRQELTKFIEFWFLLYSLIPSVLDEYNEEELKLYLKFRG